VTWTHEDSWKLAAPPARVFAALTEPGQLTRWFAECVDVKAPPAGRYRFWGRHTLGAPADGDARQSISRLDPGRALAFSWMLYGVPTTVEMALAADGDHTRLTLHHHVDGDLPTPRQKELISDHWKLAFGNLAAHLAGGSGIVLPDYTDPTPEVRLTVTIDAPREAVFRALVEPDMLRRWFDAAEPVVEPRIGGRYSLGWKYQVDGVDVEGGPTRILEYVPNERLVLDWPDWRGDKTVNGQRITFHLESEGNGTRVTFVHSGFDRPADMSDYPFGWVYFIDKLGGLFRTGSPAAADSR
jgi:uncharacterized protein YndB with AHSA1/START domain